MDALIATQLAATFAASPDMTEHRVGEALRALMPDVARHFAIDFSTVPDLDLAISKCIEEEEKLRTHLGQIIAAGLEEDDLKLQMLILFTDFNHQVQSTILTVFRCDDAVLNQLPKLGSDAFASTRQLSKEACDKHVKTIQTVYLGIIEAGEQSRAAVLAEVIRELARQEREGEVGDAENPGEKK